MSAQAKITSQSTAAKGATTGFISSRDGTTIGYQQFGHGPGVVVIHGALESARNYVDLAMALGDVFTVYIPDRRGRGVSGPHGATYSLQSEVEDVSALLQHTGARSLFGVSSGAVIALQAALAIPGVSKVAAYEPALSLPGYGSDDFVTRYEEEIAHGKTAAAIATVLKGTEIGPRLLRMLPHPILTFLLGRLIADEGKQSTSDDVPWSVLVPTMHYDFQVADEGSMGLDRFQDMPACVLLLGGSKSPTYLQAALTALENILPCATRIEFPGLNHIASGNTSQGGKPEVVAHVLRQFFL